MPSRLTIMRQVFKVIVHSATKSTHSLEEQLLDLKKTPNRDY